MRSSEAYSRFIDNITDGNEQDAEIMLSNSMVYRCIQAGFVNGMSETETVRSIILSIIKISDEDMKAKIHKAMTSTLPAFKADKEQLK